MSEWLASDKDGEEEYYKEWEEYDEGRKTVMIDINKSKEAGN